MSGLMDKAKSVLSNKENKEAQPGDSVERKADDFANSGKFRPQPQSAFSHSCEDYNGGEWIADDNKQRSIMPLDRQVYLLK